MAGFIHRRSSIESSQNIVHILPIVLRDSRRRSSHLWSASSTSKIVPHLCLLHLLPPFLFDQLPLPLLYRDVAGGLLRSQRC